MIKKILNFIFELGQLKRIKHEGWRILGISHPESVGEHGLRAAQIGYILAHMEKYPHPAEVCTIVVFHDISECRVGDIHRVASHYLQIKEQKAVEDQTKALGKMGRQILDLWKQMEHKSTIAGIIAKDADLLEQAITAKEYLELGCDIAASWITTVEGELQTNSAKKLIKKLQNSNSSDWWQKIEKKP